jgi:predicted nucleotidyltransferase
MERLSNRWEGIRPDQMRDIKAIAEVNAKHGIDTRCIIAFGSRARGTAMPDSDLDLLVLIDRPTRPITNGFLERAVRSGRSVILPADSGEIHAMFLKTEQVVSYLQVYSPILRFHGFIKGIASDAKVVYGDEPLIEQMPLTQYVQKKAKITPKC